MQTRLNLPEYAARIKSDAGRLMVLDPLRRKYVALTPEERVRQHFVHYLVACLGYPATLLANEVALRAGDKQLRADTVLYDRHLEPRMIIEYKAPSVAINEKVLQQITAYNTLLRVDYLVVSNGLVHLCCKMDYAANKLVLLNRIPPYSEL